MESGFFTLPDAGQGVDSANVHGAGAADALAAGPAEGQGGVHLVLDLDEGVEDHGAAGVEVDLVLLHGGLVAGLVGVPSVDGEGLLLGGPQAGGGLLLAGGGRGRRAVARRVGDGPQLDIETSSRFQTIKVMICVYREVGQGGRLLEQL